MLKANIFSSSVTFVLYAKGNKFKNIMLSAQLRDGMIKDLFIYLLSKHGCRWQNMNLLAQIKNNLTSKRTWKVLSIIVQRNWCQKYRSLTYVSYELKNKPIGETEKSSSSINRTPSSDIRQVLLENKIKETVRLKNPLSSSSTWRCYRGQLNVWWKNFNEFYKFLQALRA